LPITPEPDNKIHSIFVNRHEEIKQPPSKDTPKQRPTKQDIKEKPTNTDDRKPEQKALSPKADDNRRTRSSANIHVTYVVLYFNENLF
jgi:hypothetical protein